MKIENLKNFNFRDKRIGLKRNHCSAINNDGEIIFFESSEINSYFKGFLYNLYLRSSCHNCSVKPHKSGSDITIGDYWGIENILPEFYDENGVSLVMINSEKGRTIFNLLNKNERETTYAEALAVNPYIEKSAVPHKNRALFFKIFIMAP